MGEAVPVLNESPINNDVTPSLPEVRVDAKPRKARDFLYYAPEKRDLRKLARIKRVIVHYTSIDPIGEYTVAEVEILDDRIKRESLNAVVAALTAHARGAPLCALANAMGGAHSSALFPVSNVVERSSHCMFGEVAGSEVTIGDEELMLERGIILDSLSDTLVEDGQPGFYLLIAIGNATIARCFVMPPRKGDGQALVKKLKPFGIRFQVLSLGTSAEAHDCAREIGLSGEQVSEVESALHLDALLDGPEPFILLTSDPDCAEYVAGKGLVGFYSHQQKFDPHPGLLAFSSFDLRNVAKLYLQARKLVQRERLLLIAGIVAIALLGAAIAYLLG